MCGPNSQIQEGNIQQQNLIVQQQEQQQQGQQEAAPKLFNWQQQEEFYSNVSTKDKKKNYKFQVMDSKKINDILKSDEYKNDKDSYEKINQKTSGLKFREQREVKDRLFDANASILKKDKKSWWRKDSTKMADIKIAMDRVQMLMQTDFTQSNEFFIDGKLNFNKIGKTIMEEIEKAIGFCNAYLEDPKKMGSGSTATRRRGNVETCKQMLEKEMQTFRILVQPDIELTLVGNQDNLRTPRDILSGIKVIQVNNVQHQNQGNSQEVYVVDVNRTDVEGQHVEGVNQNGEKVKYYMKENLPMLDKTTDLYLDRRIKELKKGLQFKKSQNEDERKKEEYRMKKSDTDDTDYDNGITFLEAAKEAITKGEQKKKDAAKEDFCKFLAHDFDSLFRSYEEYKRILGRSAKGKEALSEEEMAKLKEQAKEDPIKSLLYEALMKQSAGEEVEVLGPFDWLVKTEIIKMDANNPLYKILESISKQGDVIRDGKSTSRLEVLLRVTTGKEAELYGQMTARAKGGTDMSQYLTMMTSEMGDVYGFDVLCKTYMAVTDFERWNEEQANGSVVTLQEEAKGMEWIELQKQAQKNGKKVKLTGNAARQLISLQVIDTISAQTDRHGRNFKCDYVEEGEYYIVNTVKAYDHDMSFSEVELENAFEAEKDTEGKTKKLKKNGFLPPMMQKISPSSPLFRYICRNYLNKKPELGWMKDIKKATYVKEPGKDPVEIPMFAKDSLLTVFYKSALSFTPTGSKMKDFYNVVNTPKDIMENCNRSGQCDKHHISQRNENGNTDIHISGDLFKARPDWMKGKKDEDLDQMPYEAFANKIDEADAKTLGIKTDDKNEDQVKNEVEAVKAIWKLSRIISELGRLMIPPAKDNKEYEYTGKNQLGNDYQPFNTSKVFKRTYNSKDDGVVTYTEEEKERIIQLGKQLKDLNDKWDFTGLYINGKTAGGTSFQGNNSYFRKHNGWRMPGKDDIGLPTEEPQEGYFDGYIQSTLEYIATMFKNDPVVNKMYAKVPDELKEFYDEKSETLELPSVLHMDVEDYNRAVNIVADFDNGTLTARMQARQLSGNSINAACSRAKETVKQIEQMKVKAEKLLRYKYPELWEQNKNKPEEEWDCRLRFFLKKEEFDKLDSLADLALDPGDTYLVQDDDDYLSTQEAFKDCMTGTEQSDAKDRREKAYMDQKRWMGTKNPKENFKPDVSAVDMSLHKAQNANPAA